MFILRTINTDNSEFNEILGDEYQLITKDCNPKGFEEIKAQYKNPEEDMAAIIFTLGKYPGREIPIYRRNKNYIMTESGSTFCNLTYK